jgi:osmotically-inducible protein OsmY
VWNVGGGTDFFLLSTIEKLAMTMIDMPLDHRVLTALEQNPHVPRRNLRFETEQGRVTLRGVVGTYYQKQMAQEAVRRVEGVREIANELEVCWG